MQPLVPLIRRFIHLSCIIPRTGDSTAHHKIDWPTFFGTPRNNCYAFVMGRDLTWPR